MNTWPERFSTGCMGDAARSDLIPSALMATPRLSWRAMVVMEEFVNDLMGAHCVPETMLWPLWNRAAEMKRIAG